MPLSELIRYFNSHEPGEGSELFIDGARVAAWHEGLRLASSFQPVFHLEGRFPVGHEAFLCVGRADCKTIPAEEAFAMAGEPENIVRFDRLCRTLHTLNFLAQQRCTGGYLYLNVHPRHLLAVPGQHGLIFEAILKRCGLGPEDIVLELDAARVGDDQRLLDAIAAYRLRDYRIALDRFGLDADDAGRLERLRPDIVKLHQNLCAGADAQGMAGLVQAAHAIGATVVAQGIETQEALDTARTAGVDLAQGFLLGRPHPDCIPTHEAGQGPARGHPQFHGATP